MDQGFHMIDLNTQWGLNRGEEVSKPIDLHIDLHDA
jgi:hypothetical protein